MIVTNLIGESELLVDYSGLKRTRQVNGDYSLSLSVLKTEKSQHAYHLVEEESIIEYDGQQYRIKDVTEVLVGVTPIKTVQASHIFFDLVDTYKYDYLENTQNIQNCLFFALNGTGYTFEVIDSFPHVVFEKFGEDTSLSLIQKALNVFGAEVKIDNKHLRFYRQIGIDTEVQIRYGYNIKTLEKYANTNNLSTYIRGYGKKNEDGSYVVTAEYTSPMATIYGIRHAKPVYDERYTNYNELFERIKSELIDTSQYSFKVDALELKKMGILTEQLEEGDRVFVIYDPLDVDSIARVMEIVDYPESSKPAEYTFGNFRNNLTSELAGFQKTKNNVDAILNGEKKLPYSALDDAVLRATEALTSALTELIFDNGVIARDPSNPNKLVLFNSKGIGISDNGGATFREAITADGFVLSAGAIGQLAANNITVGPGTLFYDNTYNPTVANANATDAKNTVNVWKYPGTTNIHGGLIQTNSILVNSLIAGVLTGFTIQTDANINNPRIHLEKQRMRSYKGNDFLSIDTDLFISGSPGLQFHDDGYSDSYIAKIGQNLTLASQYVQISSSGGTIVSGNFSVEGGSKNAAVPTSVGMVNVSAYETAECYFGDIGRGQVVEGECRIEIESLFAETVNTNIDYEVFLTPYGPGQIYVDFNSMSSTGFIVRGDDMHFAYEIKAKRKDYEDVRLELTHGSEVEELVQDASQG